MNSPDSKSSLNMRTHLQFANAGTYSMSSEMRPCITTGEVVWGDRCSCVVLCYLWGHLVSFSRSLWQHCTIYIFIFVVAILTDQLQSTIFCEFSTCTTAVAAN